MAKGGTKLIVPTYQTPYHQFLYNNGEMLVDKENGPATTLWELLLHLKDNEYPVLLNQKNYTKKELVIIASEQLTNNKDVISRIVGEAGYNEIFDLCLKMGQDPEIY